MRGSERAVTYLVSGIASDAAHHRLSPSYGGVDVGLDGGRVVA